MIQATGMLMSPGPLRPEAVRQALDDQGGPEWDETVFQMLTGVDLRSLAAGAPTGGSGTAIAFASSGWWVRALDDLADRLSANAGAPVVAVFEAPGARAAGFHLARPGRAAEREMRMVAPNVQPATWQDGIARLIKADVPKVAPLAVVAREVHGDDASGASLPGMFNFNLERATVAERRVLGEVYGTSLVGGLEWRPGARRDPSEALPSRMRVIVLTGPPRLPGPARWAKADNAEAVEIARKVIEEDGWVCLVPRVGEVLGIYGSSVQLSQFAPLPRDGRWAGVLHPREAVRIGDFGDDGIADVTPVKQTGIADAEGFDRALTRVIGLLPTRAPEVEFNEDELRASDDPARLLAWQIDVDAELSQSYLGSTDPTTRLEVLSAALQK